VRILKKCSDWIWCMGFFIMISRCCISVISRSCLLSWHFTMSTIFIATPISASKQIWCINYIWRLCSTTKHTVLSRCANMLIFTRCSAWNARMGRILRFNAPIAKRDNSSIPLLSNVSAVLDIGKKILFFEEKKKAKMNSRKRKCNLSFFLIVKYIKLR